MTTKSAPAASNAPGRAVGRASARLPAPNVAPTSRPLRGHESAPQQAASPRVVGLKPDLRAAGNQALQHLFAAGALQAKLRVGGADEPAEREADRVASQVAAGGACTCAPGGPPCPACVARGAAAALRRKARRGARQVGGLGQVALGSGRPLGGAERGYFEPRLGADLSDVRVHTDGAAARAAARLDARAFTLGSHIAFGRSEYRPEAAEGRLLLAHELAHVLQQREAPPADGAVIRRQQEPLASFEAPVCIQEPPEPQVCEAPPAAADPAHPASLNLTGSREERIAAFKQMVKTTAVHRLIANQRNLALWSILVHNVIPDLDLASVGMVQSGGLRPYSELQDIRDPMVRELRAIQAFGRYRACTGCHIENYAWGTRTERSRFGGPEWLTPHERRQGVTWQPSRYGAFSSAFTSPSASDMQAISAWIRATSPSAPVPAAAGPAPLARPGPGYRPPPGTAEARLNQLFPDPQQLRQAVERARPVLQALGPEGYKVLPGNILSDLETESIATVRARIMSAIEARQEGYGELIVKIESGEVGYEHFAPIISDLLPLADSEVASAIRKEMDDKAFWDKVEAIVVGVLSIAALLLTIFPPTSAVGVAALATLDIALAAYGIGKGIEMIETGRTYQLGVGAHDVFTPEQQAMGDAMVLGGFLSIATGILGGVSGSLRLQGAVARAGEPVAALSTVGRTIQRGEYVMTIAQDGSITATMASRPDLLIIVRGDSASLFQLTGGGGMRLIAEAPLPRTLASMAEPVSTAGGATPRLLTAGEEAAQGTTALARRPPSDIVPWGDPGWERVPGTALVRSRSTGQTMPMWRWYEDQAARYVGAAPGETQVQVTVPSTQYAGRTRPQTTVIPDVRRTTGALYADAKMRNWGYVSNQEDLLGTLQRLYDARAAEAATLPAAGTGRLMIVSSREIPREVWNQTARRFALWLRDSRGLSGADAQRVLGEVTLTHLRPQAP